MYVSNCQVASFCQVGFCSYSCSPTVWVLMVLPALKSQISWAPDNLDLSSGNHTGLRKATHLGWGIEFSCSSSEKSVLGKKGICRTAEADMSWYETMSNKLSSAKAQCSCLAHCHHNALDPVCWPLYIFVTEEEWTAVSCVERKRSRKKNLCPRKIGCEIQRNPSGKSQE